MPDLGPSMHEACRTREARSPAGAVRNAAKAADDVPSSVGIQKTSLVLDSLIGSPSSNGISRRVLLRRVKQVGQSGWSQCQAFEKLLSQQLLVVKDY